MIRYAILALAVTALNASAQMSVAVQVTHDNLDDPSFSPDGKRMVVIARRAGREQLAIANADGSGLALITSGDFNHEDPAWSPDGRTIAYVSMEGGGEVIHLMRPDGSDDRALTPAQQRAIHPSWSQDSQWLLYCTDDDLAPPRKNDSDILRISAAGGAPSLVLTGGTNTYPNLSPDGRAIVFRKMVGQSNSEVWSATADGKDLRNLTNSPAFDGWPAWSPDGRRIAFASNPGGNHKIYVMNRDGSEVRLLADTEGRGTSPKWSADGRWIYFTICKRVDGASSCDVYRAGVN